MQAFVYAVGAHSYPTFIRASGVGTAQTVSRLGGIISGIAGGAYVAMSPRPSVSYYFYVIGAAALIVVISFFSLRTHIQPNRGSGGVERREAVTT